MKMIQIEPITLYLINKTLIIISFYAKEKIMLQFSGLLFHQTWGHETVLDISQRNFFEFIFQNSIGTFPSDFLDNNYWKPYTEQISLWIIFELQLYIKLPRRIDVLNHENCFITMQFTVFYRTSHIDPARIPFQRKRYRDITRHKHVQGCVCRWNVEVRYKINH